MAGTRQPTPDSKRRDTMPGPRTPRTGRTILQIAPLVVCLLFIPIAAAAVCPVTTLSCTGTNPGGEVVFTVFQELRDAHGHVEFGGSSASYDLVAGELDAVAEVKEANTHVSRVVASDRFYLHKVAEATFVVRLNVSFYWIADNYRMAFAAAYARLEAEGRRDETSSVGPGLDRFVEIEVTASEGVPFVITYELEASGWGYYPVSTTSAWLEFLGLPPGAEITSCNGFAESAVPVEESTWGKVKALYR
jgi:hypothetical protein